MRLWKETLCSKSILLKKKVLSIVVVSTVVLIGVVVSSDVGETVPVGVWTGDCVAVVAVCLMTGEIDDSVKFAVGLLSKYTECSQFYLIFVCEL